MISRAIYQVVFSLLVLFICSPAAMPAAAPAKPAQATAAPSRPAWEVSWNKVLDGAKKEGKLVIYGDVHPNMRQQVGAAFKQKYGIPIEWLAGRANEVVQRVLSERQMNVFVPDVFADGTMSVMNFLKPTGALEPLEPKLILPEVTNPKGWLNERLWWVDNEHTHIAYLAISMPAGVINTNLVKPGEIQSYNDFLNPKWKGNKIVMDDPTQGGPGNSWVTAIAEVIMNKDFIVQLAKQEPVILRNQRQEAEWIARGKNPIGLGQSSDEIVDFMKAGAPLAVVMPKEGTFLSQSRGGVSLLKDAPHPNAAILYVNWLLSKEGQTVITKAEGLQSARIDVPTDAVESHALRQSGVKYYDTIKLDYQLKKQEYVKFAKEVFAAIAPK